MTGSTPGWPEALRRSAVPRWSHRDPVEAGNPFPPTDPRHPRWRTATSEARAALAAMDRGLDDTHRAADDRAPYAEQLVALAVARFDTWARRALTSVDNPHDAVDFGRWLEDYVTNWRRYVAETCPHAAVDVELTRALRTRAEAWTGHARAASGP